MMGSKRDNLLRQEGLLCYMQSVCHSKSESDKLLRFFSPFLPINTTRNGSPKGKQNNGCLSLRLQTSFAQHLYG